MKEHISSPLFSLIAINFCLFSSHSMVVPVIPIYAREQLGASTTEIGLVASFFFFAAVFIRLPFGAKAGGRNTPLIYLASLIVFSALPIALAEVNTPQMLILVRAAQGLAWSMSTTTGFFMVPLAPRPVDRDHALGTFTAAGTIGLMSGPAITSFTAATLGLRSSFYLASLIGFVAVAVASNVVWKILAIERQWRIMPEEKGLGPNVASKTAAILSKKSVVGAILCGFAGFYIIATLSTFVPLYARESLNFSASEISAMFFGFYLLASIARLSIKKLGGTRIGQDRLLRLYLLLAVALVLAMSVEGPIPMFVVAYIASGFFLSMTLPLTTMITNSSVRPSEMVLANALILTAVDVGYSLGPIGSSLVASLRGFPTTFAAAGVVALALTLGSMLFRKPKDRSPQIVPEESR